MELDDNLSTMVSVGRQLVGIDLGDATKMGSRFGSFTTFGVENIVS